MSVSAAIRRMIEAGFTLDQALLAAEVMEQEIAPVANTRTARQERNARYYAAKASEKRLKASEQDGSDDATVSPKKETSPTPPKEKTTPSSEPNGSSKTRAVRIPVEFEPDLGWAVGAGMSHSQALTEAEQFRDYWTAKPGKDGTKLDWPATWRQWVRNQLKRRPASRASPPRQPNVADGFAALSREIENRNDPRPSPSDESPRRSIPHLSGVQVG